MTVAEVSSALGVKVRTIRSWISNGFLPAAKVGKLWHIPASALNEEVMNRADKNRKRSR